MITPPIAVQQTKNEVLNMAKIAIANFNISFDAISTLDFSKVDEFKTNEKELNFLNKELGAFIAKLLTEELPDNDKVYLTTAIRTISDLERVGDYAENIIEYAKKLKETNNKFSSEALKEIDELRKLIMNLYNNVMIAYEKVSFAALEDSLLVEDQVDDITDSMANKHILRLSEGICTPEAGAQYLSLSSDSERIADHFINMANTIKEFA